MVEEMSVYVLIVRVLAEVMVLEPAVMVSVPGISKYAKEERVVGKADR